jgi:hypothetical protein
MQSFRHFSGDIALSPNTQPFKTKFIPYHLIISKHKYYVIKFMFHVLFLHLRFLWHLIICITEFFKGDTKSSQFFNQLFKSVLHEKLNDWKRQVRNSASSSFYMICLLSVDSVNAHLMADSYCTSVYLGKITILLMTP